MDNKTTTPVKRMKVPLEEPLDLARYWTTLCYYKVSVVFITGLILGITLMVSLSTTPIYQSKAILLLTELEGRMVLKGDNTPEFVEGYSVETIAMLAKTMLVLNDVVEKLKLPITSEKLKNLVKVQSDDRKKTIDLQVEYEDPLKAQQITQSLAEVLIDQELSLQQADAEARNIYLRNQLVRVEGSLTKSEEKLKAFQKKEDLFDIDKLKGPTQPIIQISMGLSGYSELGNLLSTTRNELEATRERMASIEAQLGMEIEEIDTLFSDRYKRPQPQQKELNELEIKLSNSLVEYSPDDPGIKEIEENIARLKASMIEEKGRLLEKTYQSNPIRQELLITYARERIELAAFTAKIKGIEQAIEKTEKALQQFPRKQLLLARLERERMINENTYLMLQEKYEETKLGKESEVGNFQIIEPASLPRSSVRPNIPQNLLLGLVLGLVLGVGTAFLREYFNDSIKDPDELEGKFEYPVLSRIPYFPLGKRLIDVKNPQSDLAELYRVITHNVYLDERDRQEANSSILITSTHAGEGKSSTTLNLALSSVMAGKKVILLETDMRRPSLAKKMNLEFKYGLQDYLLGKVKLADVLIESGIPGLRVFLAKRGEPQNPADLLDSPEMAELIEKLKHEADILYVDSPSILPLIDVSLLVEGIDGVIFIVEHRGPTSLKAVNFALTRVNRMHSRIIGLLLSKVKLPRKERYYYYYRHHLNIKEHLLEGLRSLKEGLKTLKLPVVMSRPLYRTAIISFTLFWVLFLLYLVNPFRPGSSEQVKAAEAREAREQGNGGAPGQSTVHSPQKVIHKQSTVDYSVIRNPQSKQSEIRNPKSAIRNPTNLFLGRFYSLEEAEAIAREIVTLNYSVEIRKLPHHKYTLYLGSFSNKSKAKDKALELEAEGYYPVEVVTGWKGD